MAIQSLWGERRNHSFIFNTVALERPPYSQLGRAVCVQRLGDRLWQCHVKSISFFSFFSRDLSWSWGRLLRWWAVISLNLHLISKTEWACEFGRRREGGFLYWVKHLEPLCSDNFSAHPDKSMTLLELHVSEVTGMSGLPGDAWRDMEAYRHGRSHLFITSHYVFTIVSLLIFVLVLTKKDVSLHSLSKI